MRPNEAEPPREWAKRQGWSTNLDGQDYCQTCTSRGIVTTNKTTEGVRNASRGLVLGLVGSLVLSVLYDAIPNRWFEAELEHLRVPYWFRYVFIGAKSTAAAGLLVGLRSPKVGRLTTGALVTYFTLAVGAHFRVKDKLWRFVPAVGMLTSAVLADRSFVSAASASD